MAPEDPWLGCSPDGLVRGGCLEIKCFKRLADAHRADRERYVGQARGTVRPATGEVYRDTRGNALKHFEHYQK